MAGQKKGKKEQAPAVVKTAVELQTDEMAGIKAGDEMLTDLFKLAEEYNDLEFDVFDSGFAVMNRALSPDKPGIPRGRHIEVATSEPNIGKSTITAQLGAAAQAAGFKTALAEPEATHTETYLNRVGWKTRFDPENPDIYPVRIMRPEWDLSSNETIIHSAERFLNALGKAIYIFDVVVIDSAAALCPEGDLGKDSDENSLVGGISKLLHAFFRKHPRPKATCLWVNQLLDQVGKFSPNGGTPRATVGGKAIPFYSSIRIYGSRIGTINGSSENDDPIGFWVEWALKKNKCGPQDRKFKLPYIHGEGFSVTWALMEYAITNKVVAQSGAWFQYPAGDIKKDPSIAESFGYLRVQGRLNFYDALKSRTDTIAAIKASISGEDPEDYREAWEAANGVTKVIEGDQEVQPIGLLEEPAA